MLPGDKVEKKNRRLYTLHFVEDGRGGCSVERVTEKDGRSYTSHGMHYDRGPRSVALATLFHFSTYMDIGEIPHDVLLLFRDRSPYVERWL
ncbi:hypothetical protein Y032_0030g2200 [Ancylostoma ceylanicum]|uniref:Uncharacterized protein n=1 Tax=Ancylostoma ceylanicum TaxID=53326 RepID=A0A016UT52_9BILA|nr:hypothetical protein Y032_0030g2200 [Ancylostoma ceylanicum]